MKNIKTLALFGLMFAGFMPSKTECMDLQPGDPLFREKGLGGLVATSGITAASIINAYRLYKIAKAEPNRSEKYGYILASIISGSIGLIGLLYLCDYDKDLADWLNPQINSNLTQH